MGDRWRQHRRLAGRGALGVALAVVLAGCALFEPGESVDPALEAARSPETLMRLGAFAEGGGDIDTAVQFYRRAHAANPTDPEPLIRLATLLSAVGAHADAAMAFRALGALQPGNREVSRALANALIASGEPEAASEILSTAPQGRSDPRILSSLAVALDMQGRHAEAQRSYASALSLSPNDLDIRTNLALSHVLAGNDTLAIETMTAIVDQPGANRRHRQAFALVLALAGRRDQAARTAALDLDEAGVAAALSYYERLVALPSSAARARAIGGAPIG